MSADFISVLLEWLSFPSWGHMLGMGCHSSTRISRLLYTITFHSGGRPLWPGSDSLHHHPPDPRLAHLLGRLAAETLFSALIGLITGLLTAALLAFPLSLLPAPFGKILPFLGVLLFGYFGVAVFIMRQTDIANLLGGITPAVRMAAPGRGTPNRTILLDTSVIIDGRVADIAKTGFLPGTLLIPRFVLNELQYIADSPDGLRRQRGRRGMEVLSELQKALGCGRPHQRYGCGRRPRSGR